MSARAQPPHPIWAIATGNAGKVREFTAALERRAVRLVAAADLGVGSFPPESGSTYEENAMLKAAFVALETGRVSLSDDSGLEVDALGGEPGVHSARYGGDLEDGERIAHLLRQLRSVPDERRTARFVSVVVVARPQGDVVTFRGVCEGRILQGPRGDDGFGYDPVFFSSDLERSFGEATLAEKGRVSHRGRALEALDAWLDTPHGATFMLPSS
ncbi:RdgB/HAM1 family non-canonical purine NTP pyrophosphatase [soil metagenome]